MSKNQSDDYKEILSNYIQSLEELAAIKDKARITNFIFYVQLESPNSTDGSLCSHSGLNYPSMLGGLDIYLFEIKQNLLDALNSPEANQKLDDIVEAMEKEKQAKEEESKTYPKTKVITIEDLLKGPEKPEKDIKDSKKHIHDITSPAQFATYPPLISGIDADINDFLAELHKESARLMKEEEKKEETTKDDLFGNLIKKKGKGKGRK